jgi:hypothetical protein
LGNILGDFFTRPSGHPVHSVDMAATNYNLLNQFSGRTFFYNLRRVLTKPWHIKPGLPDGLFSNQKSHFG